MGTTDPVLPSAAWAYHDPQGAVTSYVCRFNDPQNPTKKQIIPLRFLDGDWRWKGWTGQETRPLYNLHLLARRTDAPVLIVEGEKTADAASKLFPHLVVTTWMGGCGQVQKADLSPLLSRSTPIVIWPDADDPGRVASIYLKARLPNALLVPLPHGLPEGWDLADPAPPDISPRGLLDAALNPPPPPPPEPQPFRLLGFDNEKFHYASRASGIITELTASEHTESNLNRIAPRDYWLANFPPARGSTKPDYPTIVDHLIQKQFATGFFDEESIRGVGCWIDSGRVLYHAGDRLFIDGRETALHDYRGHFLYQRRQKRLSIDLSNPLSVPECAPFLDLCQRLRWADGSKWWYLPGWLVSACVGGALDWRPHAWLRGGRGTGKSWIYQNIMAAMLITAIKAQSSTTEAGLRQLLGRDALAVIFDEMESRDESSSRRIFAVLELMRQSSSETGGSIFKGSTSGVAVQYRIRSSFCFQSIAKARTQPADDSRITSMELDKPNPGDFPAIKALWKITSGDPAYCMRFLARAILNARLIRDAAAIFGVAIAHAAGNSRTGQQYGAIAAGFWSLNSDVLPTTEQAVDWANTNDWQKLREEADDEEDPKRCLDIVLQAKIKVEDDGRHYEQSVGECLHLFFTLIRQHPKVIPRYAALMRHGVHPIEDSFDIAGTHEELRKIFKGTQYADNWKDNLLRIDGATRKNYTPYGENTVAAVRIPRSSVEGLVPDYMGPLIDDDPPHQERQTEFPPDP